MENDDCKNINNCDLCSSCDSCDSCNSCDLCSSCDFCSSCDSCDFCNSCYFCEKLKMTECNVFCFSKQYDDENSFQQKRYRVFNKEVGEERYFELKNEINKILKDLKLNLKDNSWVDEWKKVSQEQWKQLLAIPEAEDFKKGFEYISGTKIEVSEELTMEQVCRELGRTIKIKK